MVGTATCVNPDELSNPLGNRAKFCAVATNSVAISETYGFHHFSPLAAQC